MRNIFKSKCLSRVKSGALAFALMAGLALPCMPMNASAEALPDTAPTITIVAAGVDKKYVEVGLSISGGAAGGIANKFQLAGAVVAYDAKLMQPIEWQPRETNGVASDVPIELPSFVRDVSTDMAQVWGTAKAIPTKGDDAFSGKTAIAVVEKTADKEAGYISLYANTTKLEESMAQKVPQGNLVAGAEAAANAPVYDLPDAQEAPIPQAVVLRFALKNPAATDAEILAQLTKAIDSVYLMKAVNGVANTREIAEASPIGDSDGAVYFKDVNGEKTAPTVNILRARMAKTFSTGGSGGSAADFATISCFDWDESLLGTIAISKTATAEEVQAALDLFVKERYSGYVDKMDFPADLSAESFVDAENTPLTYKKGYNFGGWVECNIIKLIDGKPITQNPLAETFTAYQNLADFEAEEASLTSVPVGGWGNMVFKASYVENAFCNMAGKWYTTEKGDFNRYGAQTAGIFSMKINVKREIGGYGVSRLKSPAIRVTSTASDGSKSYSLIPITNRDFIEGEIIATKTVNNINFTIIDSSQNTNWVTMCNEMSSSVDEQKGAATLKDGFVFKGTIQYVIDKSIEYNKAAAASGNAGFADIYKEWNTGMNALTLNTDAGFKYTAASGGDYPGIPTPNYATVKKRMYKFFIKNGENALDGKTYAEKHQILQDAMWDPSLDTIADNRTK